MNTLLIASLVSESPSSSVAVDPTLITPGPVGFAVFVVLILAVVGLVWDMVRRLRRTRYRAEISERLDAEEALAKQSQDASPSASANPGQIPEPSPNDDAVG